MIDYDKKIANFPYSVLGKDYNLQEIAVHKPNFGTYMYLIKSYEIKNSINTHIEDKTLKHFIFVEIPYFVKIMQNIRNESVHGSATTLNECDTVRTEVIGIGKSGMLGEFIRNKQFL